MKHGLMFSDDANKELREAESETSQVKLNVLLEVCFKCKLCCLQAAGGHAKVKTWDKFSDMKSHLAAKHGINGEAPAVIQPPCGMVTRNKHKKSNNAGDCFTSAGSNNAAGNQLTDNDGEHQNSHVTDRLFDDCTGDGCFDTSYPQETQSELGTVGKLGERFCLDQSGLESDQKISPDANGDLMKEDQQQNESLLSQQQNACSDLAYDNSKGERSPQKALHKRPNVGTGVSYLKRARTCPQCEKVLDNIEKCWHHYTWVHGVTEKLKGAVPAIEECLRSGTKSIGCPICQKESKGSGLLKHVMLVHLWRPKLKNIRRKREMLCPKCGKAFNYEQNYYLHLRSVHGGVKQKSRTKYVAKEYKCVQCEYKTCEMRRLNSHMKYAHSGIKTYSCKYCSYATWERTSLRDHLYRHKERKPYHCQVCSYQCIQKKQLRAHLMRMHAIALPKTGHTKVPPKSRARHIPCSIVQMADRETSTDPLPKRSKLKVLKAQGKDIQEAQVATPKTSIVYTSGGLSGSEVVQGMVDSFCQISSTPVEKQILHYSVQGPIISQVSPPKVSSSQFSADVGSVICTFTIPNHNAEHQLVVPSGEQVQNFVLPPGNQPLTPQKDLILTSAMNHPSQAIIASPQTMYLTPNLQEKTAYRIIPIQTEASHAIPATTLSSEGILNVSDKPTDTITVTPIYAQNPEMRNHLPLSSFGQVNPEGSTTKGSFVYVLK